MSMNIRFVNAPVANLWSDPEALTDIDKRFIEKKLTVEEWFSQLPIQHRSTFGRVESQLLYGEPVVVEEDLGDWLKVCAVGQFTVKSNYGYPGWIPAFQLTHEPVYHYKYKEGPLVYVTSKLSILKTNSNAIELSFMTKLPYIEKFEDEVAVLLPNGEKGTLRSEDIRIKNINDWDEDIDLNAVANQFIKVPFVGGGTSSYGYDCSGLVCRLLELKGIMIPRDVNEQIKYGKRIEKDMIQPFDLLFFCTNPKNSQQITHVGVYLGDDKFISARRTGLPIKLNDINDSFYSQTFWGAIRYDGAEDLNVYKV